MEAFTARRICSLCLKQGTNHAKVLRRQVSRLVGQSTVRWYPAQLPLGQLHAQKMCTEQQKPGDQKPAQQETLDQKMERIRQFRKNQDKSATATFSWKTVAIVLTIGGGTALWIRNKRQMVELEDAKSRVVSVGESALGGAWKLKDTSGKMVTEKDLVGQWSILYFGFTHCPDVCPEELDKVVLVVDAIDGNKAIPNLKPVFITVDPERDSGPVIQRYIKDFSSKILGLTGTVDEVQTACKAYRVYYSAGPKDEDNDYIVDHSIITYLVNPDGKVTDYFGKNKNAKEVAEEVENRMRLYRKGDRRTL